MWNFVSIGDVMDSLRVQQIPAACIAFVVDNCPSSFLRSHALGLTCDIPSGRACHTLYHHQASDHCNKNKLTWGHDFIQRVGFLGVQTWKNMANILWCL